MIKKLSLVLISGLVAFSVFAQNNSAYKVEQFRLQNGLTVYLNPDPDATSVFGAVVIKTGGKYDPATSTGTSHYLEHMMFKGTDEIGTTDYNAEKVYLDSIEYKYDELAKTTDDKHRKEIQKEINALSLKAGKYAIPNEMDKMLDAMGATNLNAFTSEEVVAYFNSFPANQLEKWIVLYSHRFINPVFRLFQSELETIYEEKNMYSDEFTSNMIEEFFANFYKNHPYGTQTVIGTTDHLKNPSLSTMRKMYETYYVANNMALILSGNFKTENTKELIEKHFGQWKSGDVPKFPKYEEAEFNGVERIIKKMSPIKVGAMGFRVPTMGTKESYILEICQNILNNESSTGYLDKLSNDGKVMMAQALLDARLDYGAFAVIYVPKILGQKLDDAENLVLNEIRRLREEDIDKETLDIIKLGMIKNFELSLEDQMQRAYMIGESFLTGKKWEDVLKYPEIISSINTEDVKTIANKYLGDNYLSFQSKMGFPKKDLLEKPGFDPIIPENAEAESDYARKFNDMKYRNPKIEFIDFQNDVKKSQIKEGQTLYYVNNTANDIFNLDIIFRVGTYENSKLSELAEYMMLIGTEKFSNEEFNKELQKLGCAYDISANKNEFTIHMDGFDKYLNDSYRQIVQLLINPKADDSKLSKLVEDATFLRQYEKKTPDEVAKALLNYGIYGNKSEYLTRSTIAETRNLTSEELLSLLKSVIKHEVSIHYSGSLSQDEVERTILSATEFGVETFNEQYPKYYDKKDYSENTVYLLNDKNATQSQIFFYRKGNKNDTKESGIIDAFNQYFGAGMSAIVFQEIREFRSMAYSAYASYAEGKTNKDNGCLIGFIGTQADKTIEAISVMSDLINNMPIKENRLPNVKSYLLQSLQSDKPSTRDISVYVENQEIKGTNKDPRIIKNKIYENLEFDDIYNFYNSNIKNQKMLITIVGNKKQIDMKELAKYGKIVEVSVKDILN